MMRVAASPKVLGPVLLVGGALALQGCVAAVIPLAAGGLIGNQAFSGNDNDGNETATAAPRLVVEDAVIAQPTTDPVNSDLVPLDSGNDNTAQAAAMPGLRDPGPTPQHGSLASVRAVPPFASDDSPTAPREYAPGSGFAINQLLSFANQRQIASGKLPDSAVLSDRLSLDPERAQCNAITPTVLIDLDPEGGVFDPASATRPPAGLGVGLARLRIGGVAIAWISANPMEKADEVRKALARSGLDANEEDRLLLLRAPDDRKQKLREELAGVTCLIAIAGDTRSDFDELYDYLLNPADAQSLEPLIGDGWFLIPQPLLPERPN
ncbi:MAG: hypothetical protein V2J51_06500 [Erythrobacter sp.]|jgi:hypothetical protein|nr:hypothetical protein [Erythrobacter sp.]